jgi:hypothetical protein
LLLKLRARQINLAQIGAAENSTFEMPPAQNQRVLDAIELLRIVDLRRFERVEIWKHQRIRKEALAPLACWIDFSIEQEIVEGGPFRRIVKILCPEPYCSTIERNPLPVADPLINPFARKGRRSECKAYGD